MDHGEDVTYNYKIYKQPDIVKFVKLQILKGAGHLARMKEDRCCKKIFLMKPMGNRPRGRPPLRWIDCVERDLNIFKTGKQLPKVGIPEENFWRKPGNYSNHDFITAKLRTRRGPGPGSS
ncbi:hypothetical protein TNCV_1722651 [Trichonephila clavipes]|nr:hypothetical protein TNCV_1722651 [Trichonephila clavipes]